MVQEYGFTQDEKRSLLFYQGGGKNIELELEKAELKDFYSIDNSYETINMLLFPGVDNEIARLDVEDRKLDSHILDFFPELLKVYCNMYSAICKYTYLRLDENWNSTSFSANEECRMLTYRDDRFHTYDCMKEGEICSFMSTTKNQREKPGERSAASTYFQKKNGLVLLECDAVNTVEHLDMNAVLREKSVHPEENEILFPPFLYCDLETIALTEEELKLRDIHDQSPMGKFRVIIKGATVEAGNSKEMYDDLKNMRKKILKQEEIQNAKEVWESLEKHIMPSNQAILQYIQWKKWLRIYLRECFSIIKWDILYLHMDREEQFYQDLLVYMKDANIHREKYEKELESYYTSEIIIGGLSALAFALALVVTMTDLVMLLKCLGLFFVAVCCVMSGICKCKSLEEKWKQRTVTFLRLDELKRDFDYEEELSEERIEQYIERLKQIIREDNQKCELYTRNVIKNFNELSKKMSEKMSN